MHNSYNFNHPCKCTAVVGFAVVILGFQLDGFSHGVLEAREGVRDSRFLDVAIRGPGALGAASFTALRAYGAFVVSSAIDATGTIAPVLIASEVGGDVVLETPWPHSDAPTVNDGAGAPVPTQELISGVYSFTTKAGETYTITDAGK